MKRAAALALLVGFAAPGFAQAPIEPSQPTQLPAPQPAPNGCGDALLVSVDAYDFTNARGGGSGTFEWIHCDSVKLAYSLGASAHSVADSKWQLARAGGTFRPRPELILYANSQVGSGDTAGSDFDYLLLTDGLIAKVTERLYVKTEHQLFHIGTSRGNVLRLAGILSLAPAVTAEISEARSFDSNLAIRIHSVRLDWDAGAARPFVGAAGGRQIPQAFEAAAGTASADFTSRQWFTGVSVPFKRCDWIVAFDYQRGAATSRRTFTSALKFALR